MSSYIAGLEARDVVGYRHGLRQPAQRISLRVPALPAGIPWGQIDSWLFERMAVDMDPCPPLPAAEHAAPGMSWAWRVLLLARTLLRFGGVPVFEAGCILRVMSDTRQPGQWIVEAAVAQIDYLPAHSTVQAYEAAAIVVSGLAARPDDFTDPEPLYKQLEATVIGPLWQSGSSTHSTLAILAAAYRAGIPWRHQGGGIYQLGWGARRFRLQSSQLESDSLIGQQVAHQKDVTARWLKAAGLPVPEHRVVDSFADATQAAAALGGHIVVKPVISVGGRGVSLRVTTEDELRIALAQAKSVSEGVLVERFVAGDTHHVQVVRGRVCFVLRRHPPGVKGDGQHTIAERVAQENAQRQGGVLWSRLNALPFDDAVRACLARAGLTPASIPTAGAWVKLCDVPGNEQGSRDEDVTALIHADNVRLAVSAVQRLGLDMAGVDIISPDIAVPWHVNGAVINEINHGATLGTDPVSRAALPRLVTDLVPENGRIPFEVFVGDAAGALSAARASQRTWINRGVACFACSDAVTIDDDEQIRPMALKGAFSRARALLMNDQVGAIVMVLSNDEWLDAGLPLDRITRLEVIGGVLHDHRSGAALGQARVELLISLLRAHLVEAAVRSGLHD